MRAGGLDRKITVLRDGGMTRNAMNEPVPAWAEYGVFWARELQQRPTESWKAGQTAAQLESAWRIRWSAAAAGITTTDKLTVNGREYRIIGVTEPLRRTEIEIIGVADA